MEDKDIFNIQKSIEQRLDYENHQKNLLMISHFKKPNYINEVREKYIKGELVLVLGAGVSISCGLPDWDKLLQLLLAKTFEKDQSSADTLANIFDSVFNLNNLIVGRFLDGYYKGKDFQSEIRNTLYSNLKKVNSTLVEEIVNMCSEGKDSTKLDSIITYNFDDILEEAIKTKSEHVHFRSIFNEFKSQTENDLFIYHVHGYLPRDGTLSKLNKITFSENSYHTQYSDTYSWQNLIQINKFRDKTCLFIGNSLTDPNLRRLLDISNAQKEIGKCHYIIKCRNDFSSVKRKLQTYLTNKDSNSVNRLFALLDEPGYTKSLCEVIENFEEKDALSFNIKTLWVDDHNSTHLMLKKIRDPLPKKNAYNSKLFNDSRNIAI